jgi:hypothetical protein
MASALQPPFAVFARQPLVWLLLGNCVGDNNQLLALADALDFPFEAKPISYNALRHISFLRRNLTIVDRRSRDLIRPPWPDLVICSGYGSVPVARYIRRQSGGHSKLVHIGNPRSSIDDFDLQITTPQYAGAAAPNLLALPFPIGNPARALKPTPAELVLLNALPRPRRLIAVGGPARHWELDHSALARAVRTIQEKQPAGSIIVATSHRTSSITRELLESLVDGRRQVLVDDFPRFGVLLSDADEIFVTADSVSMVSEAVFTGRPVGLIPIRRSVRGLLSQWFWERPTGRASFPNFENFWALLRRDRLVGTVELPVASQVCDTVERAARAVRSLVATGDGVDEPRPQRTASDLGAAWRARR